jgi:peptide/nickel transport system permease protein
MTETVQDVRTRAQVQGSARRAFRYRHPRLALWVALGFIVVLVLAGFFAPLPYDPSRPNPGAVLQPPSAEHWLGTDRFGFDVFSRLVASARLDIPLAAIGMLVSLLLGVPIGLVASAKHRWSERLMRGLDMFQAFPLLVLAIAVVALMGNRLENVVVAIAIINVPRFIRLVRSEALSLRESRFIEAAHAIGASPPRVMFRHLLPNMTGTILAQASLAVAHSIVVIAALSFLGIGVRSFDSSWGAMIQSGAQTITTGQWWAAMFPSIAVFLTIFAFNAMADVLQATSRGGQH